MSAIEIKPKGGGFTTTEVTTFSWRNDDASLHEYFLACVINWKEYGGPRTAKQVLKIQTMYKQAVFGDNDKPPPENLKSIEAIKWLEWDKYRGVSKQMAKRRFITLLASVNPLLIDILPAEKPPEGFPVDYKSKSIICAKCNTTTGCIRPLMNAQKVDLRTQLFECEELHETENLRVWLIDALENQRCVWGVHKPIYAQQAKEHTAWFNRNENKGFKAYDTSFTIMGFIKELVQSYHESAHEMMLHKDEYDAEEYNILATKVFRLKEVYESLSGEEFVFELPCDRMNVAVCNRRREMDRGHNHTHPFEIDKPVKIDTASYEDALVLRKECQALGLSCSTGKVETIQQRVNIYKARIEEHHRNVKKSEAAKERNDKRLEVHTQERKKVLEKAKDTIIKQCKAACDINDSEKVTTLVRRGCPPDTESNRGITPLLCCIINAAPSEAIEGILAKKANANFVTQMGYTALIMAARLRDLKAIHVIMHSGGAALQSSGRKGRYWTVLHHCAAHSCEEEMRVIVDYVKEGGGDILRVTRFLDYQNMDGDSALMLAAKKRNGLMCRILTTLGANPNLRNNQGRNACYLARQAGWGELSDWLEKKIGSGVAKLETYSDLQYDKALRYGTVKIREALEAFGKEYTKTVLGYLTRCPLQCPSAIKQHELDKEVVGLKEHQRFMDMHCIHVLEREHEFKPRDDITETERIIAAEGRAKMKELLTFMVAEIRKGTTNPNAEYTGNPLPWTPLQCAVAVNDVRSIRLLVREGADPNHPNKFGITALMVAAQLHNVEALVELLIFGGEMAQVDNEGFNAMAYATSLPLPQSMAHSVSGVIIGSDVEGIKRLNAMDVFLLSNAAGGKGSTQAELLKETVAQNDIDISKEKQTQHFKFLRLLEENGMSRMETIPQILRNTHATTWRIGAKVTEEDRSLLALDEVETKSEQEEREYLEQLEADREAAQRMREADPHSNWERLRCPLCTLLVPCNHFFKVSTLKDYLQKLASGQKIKLATATGRTGKKKGVKMIEHKHNVLEIAGLHDRQTDRSMTTMKGYRERDWQLQYEGRQLKKAEEAKRTKAALKAAAIADGTWEEWKRHYDVHGVMHYHHVETGEEWFECFDQGTQKSYYFNPETSESSWIAPPDRPPPLPPTALSITDATGNDATAPTQPSIPGMDLTNNSNSSEDDNRSASPVSEAGGTAQSNYKGNNSSSSSSTTTAQSNNMNIISVAGTQGPIKGVLKKAGDKKDIQARLAKLKLGTGEKPPEKHIKFRFVDENGENAVIIDHNGVETLPLPALENGENTENAEGVVAPLTVNLDHVYSPPGSPSSRRRLTSPDGRTRITSPGGTRHGLDDDGDSLGSFRNVMEIGMAAKIKELNELSRKMTVIDALPPNPVPPESRSMFMFTQEFMDRSNITDGLLAAKMRKPAKVEDESLSNSVRNSAHRSGEEEEDDDDAGSVGSAGGSDKPPPMLGGARSLSFSGLKYAKNLAAASASASTTAASANVDTDAATNDGDAVPQKRVKAENPLTPKTTDKRQDEDDNFNPIPEIRLSGWVFVSLSSLTAGHSPVDTIHLSLENWGMILEHLKDIFLHKWVPEMNITALPNIISWKITAPRCTVCNIGYCRWKDVESVPLEDRLCLTCLVRRELYEKVKQVLPRSFRKKIISSWPFLEDTSSERIHTAVPNIPTGSGNESSRDNSRAGSPPSRVASMRGGVLSASKSERGGSLLSLPPVQGAISNNNNNNNTNNTSLNNSTRRANTMTPERKRYNDELNPNSVFSPGETATSLTMSAELQALDEAETEYDQLHPDNVLMPTADVNPWRKDKGEGMEGGASSPFAPGSAAFSMSGKSLSRRMKMGRSVSPERPKSNAGNRPDSSDVGAGTDTGDKTTTRTTSGPGRPGSRNGSGAVATTATRKPKSRERERSREARKKKDKKAKKNSGVRAIGFGMIDDDSSEDDDIVIVSRGKRGSSGRDPLIDVPEDFNREEAQMKKEGPAELTMLSYLIAKGHFEETERISRLCIRNEAIPLINEGQGVSYLVKLFHILGEMYKLMGLWTLALGLYMDSTDMIVSLLGYEDNYAIESLGFSTNCLRKMHLPVLAKSYISHITRQIEEQARNKTKATLGRKILDAEREHIKLQLKSDDIWHMLKADMPTQERKKKAYFIHGLGSLFNLMVASEGYAIVAKSLFMQHCAEVDPHGMGKFAEFASYCFRLRVCDCEEIFGHLVRHLLQKQLNANLVETSELAALWNSSISSEIKTAVSDYVTRGIPIHSNIFDTILKCAMMALTPEYRRFFYSEKGTILRQHYMDADEEAAEMNATVIQTALRMKLAAKVKGKLMSKLAKVKEAKEAHEKHMSSEYSTGKGKTRDLNAPDMANLGLFNPARKAVKPVFHKPAPEFW